jgi:hypothetical protein
LLLGVYSSVKQMKPFAAKLHYFKRFKYEPGQ